MLTQTIWWVGNVLMGVTLYRGVRVRLVGRYPVFYAYLLFVFVDNLVAFVIYLRFPSYYSTYVWNIEFLTIIIGCFVIWEIYDQVFRGFPGAFRMVRGVLLLALAGLLGRYIASVSYGAVIDKAENLAVLERDILTAQAVLVAGIIVLLGYYRIVPGPNLRGIIVGYGFVVGSAVVILAVQAYLWETSRIWSEHVQPAANVVTLGIWCATLWSYHPDPKPVQKITLERDYEFLANQTAQIALRARRYLLRGAQ